MAAGLTGAQLEQRHLQIHARTKMFAPGQPMAMELAKNPTVLIVNRTLFAHGGVLPCHGEISSLQLQLITLTGP